MVRTIQEQHSADPGGRAFYPCDPALLRFAGIRHVVPQRTTAMLDAPTAEAIASGLSEQEAACGSGLCACLRAAPFGITEDPGG